MDTKTFETQLSGRIVNPLIDTQLSASAQKQYIPEEFINIMKAGSNSVYHIDKEKVGAQTYRYSVNTIPGVYIWTAVTDVGVTALASPPTLFNYTSVASSTFIVPKPIGLTEPVKGGTTMGLEDYFKAHQTQLWLFKHGTVLVAGMVITLGVQYIATGQVDPVYAGYVSYALTMANEKLKVLDPETYWPGVGAPAPLPPKPA